MKKILLILMLTASAVATEVVTFYGDSDNGREEMAFSVLDKMACFFPDMGVLARGALLYDDSVSNFAAVGEKWSKWKETAKRVTNEVRKEMLRVPVLGMFKYLGDDYQFCTAASVDFYFVCKERRETDDVRCGIEFTLSKMTADLNQFMTVPKFTVMMWSSDADRFFTCVGSIPELLAREKKMIEVSLAASDLFE